MVHQKIKMRHGTVLLLILFFLFNVPAYCCIILCDANCCIYVAGILSVTASVLSLCIAPSSSEFGGSGRSTNTGTMVVIGVLASAIVAALCLIPVVVCVVIISRKRYNRQSDLKLVLF